MNVAELLRETDANQARAADPGASVWVSANAGTGKTTVLVNRVLRLLLHPDPATGGTVRPESILCLTYTKAAAGEMANRLFEELSAWATLDDAALAGKLARLGGETPDAGRMRLARRLFARTLDTKGGLKIYTIHAFCERLLQRFPLEAGVASGFSVLDEGKRRLLLDQATDAVLDRAWRADDPLNSAHAQLVALAGEEQFRTIVDRVVAKREEVRALIRVADDLDFAAAESAAIARLLGAPDGADEQALMHEMAAVFPTEKIRRCLDALDGGHAWEKRTISSMTSALVLIDQDLYVEACHKFFITGDGNPNSQIVGANFKKQCPELYNELIAAQDAFCALAAQACALRVAQASGALLELADAVIGKYETRKQARAALDYDDLIERTASLLTGVSAAAWVLYKLDYGIDHILVDEAQDTSPPQWRVIDALTDEFFAGRGGRETSRTVFAVGDEKQSIYSFQGADPAKFAEQGRRFKKRALDIEADWRGLPLTVSFRSTEAVLGAVDAVFARDEAAKGLTFDGDVIVHQAIRAGQAGLVEIWEPVTPAPDEPAEPFRPHDEKPAGAHPVDVLARQIADTIKGWLDTGARLESRGGAIRAGDILILVRRRDPFTRAMIRELKARRIAVAGADRMWLSGQLAVMDLVALGDFLLMVEDDLSLATVLKSPLFGLDDDDLFALAHGREGSLWDALRDKQGGKPSYAFAVARLTGWLARADYAPPYEFYARLLEEHRMQMRHRLIARLGQDAADALDEFLNLALLYERETPPSLQGFLEYVRDAGTEVKRDMEQGRNEVRVMTVHGAKGLEAEIVFLPDTCALRTGERGATLLGLPRVSAPPGMPEHIVWVPPGSLPLKEIEDAKERRKERELEEHNRLLYVAMTRARDRLYVCGWQMHEKRPEGCWYDLVFEGLKDRASEVVDGSGCKLWRYENRQDRPPEPERPAGGDIHAPLPLPGWATADAPREAWPALAVAPSAIAAESAEEMAGIAAEQDALSPAVLGDRSRFRRGLLIHALLQHLPAVAAERRDSAARSYVAARGGALSPEMRLEIVTETLAVLNDPTFAPLFAPGSLAEVPLAAHIARTDPALPSLDISGQIDRLAVTDDAILIVDYKTNRPPPTREEDAAPAYVRQLAAYRAGAALLFPGRRVRAALLWTDGPRLMEISAERLDAAQMALVGRPDPLDHV